jgi:hypothetical protein
MKNIKLLSVLFFITMLAFACKKRSFYGPNGTEDRYVSNFTEVESRVSANVTIIESNTYSLKIDAPETYIENLLTEVKGKTLIIKTKSNLSFNPYGKSKIFISMPKCNVIKTSGSGNLDYQGEWRGENLSLDITGSGNVTIDKVKTNNLEIKNSGSANIDINSGDIGYLNLSVSGSGNYNSLDALIENAKIKISGSGNAKLYVKENLDIRLSGSGDVKYKGSPRMNLDVTGSGNVKSL